jgi:hypothetical protein
MKIPVSCSWVVQTDGQLYRNWHAVFPTFLIDFAAIKMKLVWIIKCDTQEDEWDSEDIASDINLGTRWRWVVRFTPRPLYPRRNLLQHSFLTIHGGSQSWAGHYSENKNSCSCQEPNPGCQAFNQSVCLWFISRHRQYLDCTTSNSRMTDERWIGKDLEGSSHGIIRALTCICLETLRKNTEMSG